MPSKCYVYVNYGVAGESWHEHFAVMPAEGDEDSQSYVILMADDDIYIESLSSPPLAEVIWGGARRYLPPGLGSAAGNHFYRFAKALTMVDIRDAERRAEEMLDAERRRRDGVALT